MKLILVFITLLPLMSCNEKKADPQTEVNKLKQTAADWEKTAPGSPERLTYWADNAIIMNAGQPTVNGKSAIKKMIEGASKIPGFKIQWDTLSDIHVSASGDLAYSFSRNQITVNDSTGKPISFHNRGITIWKKGPDGNWKSAVEVYNPEEAGRK